MEKMKISALRHRIDGIVKYLSPFLPLANCHMVEYIKRDHWQKYIPREIIFETEENGFDAAINVFWKMKNILDTNTSNGISLMTDDDEKHKHDTSSLLSEVEMKKFENLIKFIQNAFSHRLIEDEFCITVSQLKKKIENFDEISIDSLRITEFMSDKKSHEVEKLSSVLAELFNWSNASHVIDLGGGKGYLSAMLTMFYHIPVLNVDCSELNAKGANDRNNKLERLWPDVLKKAEDLKNGVQYEKKSRTRRKKKHKNNMKCDEDYVQNTAKKTTSLSSSPNKSNNDLYRHVTDFVTHKTDLIKLVKDNFQMDNYNTEIKLCLTGLHTCGSLGTSTLKIFVQSPSSSILCTVPCCYHLIKEYEQPDSLYHICENSEMDDDVDFPMSDYLRGFTIGRNARMLAAQSVDRVIAFQQLPAASIFYRALLQVLIFDIDCSEGKMRKVGENCNNFLDYVNMASKKLKFDRSKIALNDEQIHQLELDYKYHNESLNVFYLLRMCLAPVIENLILLDRLMYLSERGFAGQLGDAFLVKMFDPVLSPRCTSLVAFRNKK